MKAHGVSLLSTPSSLEVIDDLHRAVVSCSALLSIDHLFNLFPSLAHIEDCKSY